MGRAIARIADLRTSAEPKTTFTVGVASGGTAINVIATEARMQVDIRSNDEAAILELEDRILAAVAAAARDENARWGSSQICAKTELLAERPGGAMTEDAPIVRVALEAYRALRMEEPVLMASSTDSNVPIALGIPALTLDGGGIGGGHHSPDEWYLPAAAWRGPQRAMLVAVALVGLEGRTDPVLCSRPH